MPATITGRVFDDLNHNGIYDIGEPGIPNVYLGIEDPGGTCLTPVQTDINGIYTFSGLVTVGNYIIYETVADPGASCPPSPFTQPAGFTNSTTYRTDTVSVTQGDIDTNATLTGKNFGHDNPELFSCVAVGYQVAVPPGETNSEFVEVNLVTGTPTTIKADTGFNINAIGYNVNDDLIYGLQASTTNLIRIAADGTATNFGPVAGLPGFGFVGSFDGGSNLYILRSNTMYVIDVDQNSPTFGTVLPPGAIPLSQNVNTADWAYNPVDGFLYGVNTSTGNVEQISLAGTVTTLATTGLSASGYGAVFADADGFIYAIQNSTGKVFRITISGGNADAVLFSQAVTTNQNDGASCHNARLLIDFGDAPDTALGNAPGNYNTLLASNGPRHQIRNTLFLGRRVTPETDAYQNPTATGDDLILNIQDDSISLPIPPVLNCNLTYSIDILVTNDTGSDANLYVWIDFNQNGVFEGNEAALPIVVGSGINPSLVTATFDVPGPLATGPTFLRARVTTGELINTNPANAEDTRSLGPAFDGEVEDYELEIIDPATLITPIKTADKTYMQPGETINYTILIPNTSPYDASNVVFRDVLSPGFSLVPGSFTVNGSVINNPNLATGVPLGDLNSGDNYVINFNARLNDDKNYCGTFASNQAFIDLEFCEGVTSTIATNIVTVDILCIELSMIKKADTELLVVGDIVTYTITLKNTGSVTLDNIVLTDEINECASFVENSVTINGVQQIGLDPTVGIPIGTLPPGVSVIVGFSVRLDEVCCPASLSNKAEATYEYTIFSQTFTGSDTSNTVIVPVAPTSFKQLSVDENLTIPSQKPDVESIIQVLVDAEITNTKIIKTIKGTSEGGQILSGLKLIIEGKLNQKIEYVADDCEQSVHAAHFKVPFSTFIILPDDVDQDTEIEVEPFIEDIFYQLIDKRTVFKNVTFMLLAKYSVLKTPTPPPVCKPITLDIFNNTEVATQVSRYVYSIDFNPSESTTIQTTPTSAVGAIKLDTGFTLVGDQLIAPSTPVPSQVYTNILSIGTAPCIFQITIEMTFPGP